jgi:hypothetical protein
MEAKYKDSTSLVAKCEMEDLPKLCMQQWKQPGWYCESPITDVEVPPLSDHHRAVFKQVARFYKTCLPRDYDTNDFRSLALLDYDPDDTMTGSPTFASGNQTHEARIANLAAAPVPDVSPEEWYSQLLALQSQIGWPDPCMYSPVLSTRMGPRVKPMRLWKGSDGYMESDSTATGAYNRVRFVYPAPYLINYLWSPIYKQLSETRKVILGLWHDPESQEKYILALKRQGGFPYSVDFSGLDTGMMPHIIQGMVEALIEAGFCQWPLRMMQVIYDKMGIIFPSWEGGVENISLVTGPARPWCSGFKLTSEFDTIYGLSVILDSLDHIIPGIMKRYLSKSWILCELGDDIIFTLDHQVDFSSVQEYAEKTWGAKLKVNEDLMFLKWMLPLNNELKSKARPFARFMQQTFFNEDRYSGVEGGDRPDPVLRMALKARAVGLKEHPDYDLWMPKLLPILKRLKYVSSAPPEYISDVLLGEKLCTDDDQVAIMSYARTQPSYFLNLQERAKYEPSAAMLVSLWEQVGIAKDQTPALEIRKIYDKALFSQPTPTSLENLMRWTNGAVS